MHPAAIDSPVTTTLARWRARLELVPPLAAAALLVALPLVYRPMGAAPGQAADALLGPKTLVAALAALAMAGVHVLLALGGRRSALPRSVLVALAAFVGAFALSAIGAGFDEPVAARALQHACVFTALFLATAASAGRAGIVLGGAVAGGVLGAALVTAQAYGWSPPGIHWEEGMALPAGTFPNRNFAAYPIAGALIIAAWWAARPSAWWRRALAVAAAAVCALALVLSCSRGAWAAAVLAALGAAAVGGARAWQRRRAPLSWRGATALAFVGAVVVAGTSIRPAPATAEAREQAAKHPTSIAMRLDVAAHHESVSTRLDLWRGALTMARARPLLGWGAAGYLAAIDAHAPGGATHTHAHNELIHVAAVAGIPAALALALFLAAVAWAVLRRWHRDPSTTPLVLVLLLPVALGPPAIEIMTLSPIFGPLCAVLLGAALAGVRRPA